MRTRSFALAMLRPDSPVGSENRLEAMPTARALAFMAATKASSPPG